MDFEWDADNIHHIWRHRVRPHEAEEAIDDPQAWPVEEYWHFDERREAFIGSTSAGRILFVVFTRRD